MQLPHQRPLIKQGRLGVEVSPRASPEDPQQRGDGRRSLERQQEPGRGCRVCAGH